MFKIEGFDIFCNRLRRNQNDGAICYVNKLFSSIVSEVNFYGAKCLEVNVETGSERFTVLFISDLERYCDSRVRDRTYWIVGDIKCCILDSARSAAVERYLDVLYAAG
ncbi:hypothetical protein J6590_077782, partial [Homalodisca vitripennis]